MRIRYSHFHISKIKAGCVNLLRLIRFIRGSRWRIVHFMTLYLLIELFLADETLVTSCEVVVGEELG